MKPVVRIAVVLVCLAVIAAAVVVFRARAPQEAPVVAVEETTEIPAETVVETTPPAQERLVSYTCGTHMVRVMVQGNDTITLDVDGQEHHLSRSISASGAKYDTAPGIQPAVMFWGKGNDAFLEIDGGARIDCRHAGVAMDISAQASATPEVVTEEDVNTPPVQGAIEDTVWQASRMNGKPLAEGVVITLKLESATGRIAGRSGCNRYTGPYAIDVAARSLTITGPVAGTRMACLPALMEAENTFNAALPTITAYTLEAGELVIYAQTQEILRLTPEGTEQ